MKAKNIRMVLRKKVNDWVESIEDSAVKFQAEKNTIVTGGCITSMLLNEQVNDFDLYFRNQETATVLARYYVDKFKANMQESIKLGRELPPISVEIDSSAFYPKPRIKIVVKSAGVASERETTLPYEYFEGDSDPEAARASQYIGEVMTDWASGDIEETYDKLAEAANQTPIDKAKPYRPVFLSTNAISLTGKIQLVFRFYGEPDDIHENYDFVHCTNYWKNWDNELVLRPAALEATLAKELRYVGSRYPICSIMRLRKFIRRGWTVNAGQILKMALQVSKLDLSNLQVLEDQLTGVDVAYFNEVIQKLKKKDKDRVDNAYLLEILDRLF